MKVQHVGPEKDRFYAKVGAAIQMARMNAGMSARVLGRECDLNENTIQHAEQGVSCSLMALAKIAHALDMTLDELVPLDALT